MEAFKKGHIMKNMYMKFSSNRGERAPAGHLLLPNEAVFLSNGIDLMELLSNTNT